MKVVVKAGSTQLQSIQHLYRGGGVKKCTLVESCLSEREKKKHFESQLGFEP